MVTAGDYFLVEDALPLSEVDEDDEDDFESEDELFESECNHSLQYSMRYMMENHLSFGKITSWLNDNGGYCDCKVLEQIAPQWRLKFGDD